jgi:hypothetical protein
MRAASEVDQLWRSRQPSYEYDPDAERHNELLLPRKGRARE